MITQRRLPGCNRVRVTFELPESTWADSVHLVGDFNGWNQASHPLIQDQHNPNWHISLELEANREYEFRYLLDGTQWVNDYHAHGYAPNAYGGDNSVVSTQIGDVDESTSRLEAYFR